MNTIASEPRGLVDEVQFVHSLLGKLTAPITEFFRKLHIHTIYMVCAKMLMQKYSKIRTIKRLAQFSLSVMSNSASP